MSHWELAFFGLTPENKIELVWEQQYYLIRHCRFSYTDAVNLPVAKRHWFIQRLAREYQDKNRETNKAASQARQGSKQRSF
jgi:hypothetical protein